MAVVLASGNAGVSIVGYALVGAGLAPVVPILFNAATRVPGPVPRFLDAALTLTIFGSAFLLLLVRPIVARHILRDGESSGPFATSETA